MLKKVGVTERNPQDYSTGIAPVLHHYRDPAVKAVATIKVKYGVLPQVCLRNPVTNGIEVYEFATFEQAEIFVYRWYYESFEITPEMLAPIDKS